MVNGDIGGLKDRCQLMLGRGDFIVLGLGRNTQFPQLAVQGMHILGHLGFEDAEVVVLHFLSLGGRRSHEGAAGQQQVFSLFVEFLVDQEIFLLGTDCRIYVCHICVAQKVQDLDGSRGQSLHGTQEGGLFIQSLAAVGAEGCRDIERAVLDEGGGAGVPGGVAACLEGGAQAARREAGGIRFSLDQFLAGKLHDDTAVGGRRNETVMLLCGQSCHGLEPVCEVGRPLLNCPFLHCRGNCICHIQFQVGAVLAGLADCLIDILGQALTHDLVIEDHAGVDFGNFCIAFHHLIFLLIIPGSVPGNLYRNRYRDKYMDRCVCCFLTDPYAVSG